MTDKLANVIQKEQSPQTVDAPAASPRSDVVGAVPSQVVERIRELYDAGLYLQAYRLVGSNGELTHGFNGSARTVAGRLARQIGAPRLGRWQILRAWQEARTDPEVCYYYAFEILERRGPLATQQLLRRIGELPDAPPAVRSSWFGLHARVATLFRDFDEAERWLVRAEEVGAERAWIAVERSHTYQCEDRPDLALESARHALDLCPWYRPGVMVAAEILTHLSKDEEAVFLLTSAMERIESAAVLAQLCALLEEMGREKEALACLDRFADFCPLMEEEVDSWLAGRRSDLAYLCGDHQAAARYAGSTKSPFHKRLASRLADPALPDRRVLLPVGFVRQHYLTCAPATLSAISRFWSMPADHLQVAEEICYNGTPTYNEVRWAREHGWVAQEFTVTWESARALLDRKLPFTLTTTSPGQSHLQAVIGYDLRRGTLLIRDPMQRHHGEALADEFLNAYRANGPRGMVLVPQQSSGLLDGLDLPDASLWGKLHELDRRLVDHRRGEAGEICGSMAADAPDHWLSLEARARLGVYDGNMSELLACVEALLLQFPDDQTLQLRRLSLLKDQERRDERVSSLSALCERPGIHPLFWHLYAQELSSDARDHRTAVRFLRRLIRATPQHAGGYFTLAQVLWGQRRFQESLDLYRIAACLDDRDEHLAEAYFSASLQLQQGETGRAFLEARFRRFGKKSAGPAQTLVFAYRQMEMTGEALRILDEALALRPEDGDLMLYAADFNSTSGHAEMADRFLARARDHSSHATWLHSAARIATFQGRPAEALDLYRQLVEHQPLAVEAHSFYARLLAERVGTEAALKHLEDVTDRFSTHYGLHRLRIQWLRDERPMESERAIRRLLELNPADAWALRELALILAENRKLDEAFVELDKAFRVEPLCPAYHCVKGNLQRMAGRFEEEKESYREAIRLAADTEYAVGALIGTAHSRSEVLEAVSFVQQELLRQKSFGDGLLFFRARAMTVLEPEELLAYLREALLVRRDLWTVWSANIVQLVEMGRQDEALSLATEATERFPFLPRIWYDLAQVHHARGELPAATQALERALQLNPSWGGAARALASMHADASELDGARTILERALDRSPRDAQIQRELACVLWRLGQRESALARMEQALVLEPGFADSWNTFRTWCQEVGAGQRPLDVARRLVDRRPGDARSFRLVAEMLDRPEDLEARVRALERTIELNPALIDARDMMAVSLAQSKRFDEALAVCRPTFWGDRAPVQLEARRAWVWAQSGRLDNAIDAMKEVVVRDPDLCPAWESLTEWLGRTGRARECVEAAEQVVRLNPKDCLSFGYRASARLASGNRVGAKMDFVRALEIKATDDYAAERLLALHLEDRDVDAAERLLDDLEARSPERPFLMACSIRVAAKRWQYRRAEEALAGLVAHHEIECGLIATAVEAMDRAGWRSRVDRFLALALRSGGTHPYVGELHAIRHVEHGGWGELPGLSGLPSMGKAGHRALLAYVTALGQSRHVVRLRWTLYRHAALYRSDTELWGQAACALTEINAYRPLIEWMNDWEKRRDVTSWMLANLALALRFEGRDKEAARVSRAALERTDEPAATSHRLYLAADLILEKNTVETRKMLHGIVPTSLTEHQRILFDIINATLPVVEAAQDDRARIFAQSANSLDRTIGHYPYFGVRKERRRILDRCLLLLARHVGGVGPFARCAWLWIKSRLSL